jgi:hypothetical protein
MHSRHQTHLDAIRADLDRRATTPSISTDDIDERLAVWCTEQDAVELLDLA